jgi:hypothetical protein
MNNLPSQALALYCTVDLLGKVLLVLEIDVDTVDMDEDVVVRLFGVGVSAAVPTSVSQQSCNLKRLESHATQQ